VLRMGGWAAEGGELDRETTGRTRHNWTGLCNGMCYVRKNAGDTVIWTIFHIIGTRRNDIQRQKQLAEISGGGGGRLLFFKRGKKRGGGGGG